MSRLNIEDDVYNDGINDIISDLNAPKEDKIVLFDYDSMLNIIILQDVIFLLRVIKHLEKKFIHYTNQIDQNQIL